MSSYIHPQPSHAPRPFSACTLMSPPLQRGGACWGTAHCILRRASLVLLLLLLTASLDQLCVRAQASSQHQVAAAHQVQRHVDVADLTDSLLSELAAHNITRLLVLGTHGDQANLNWGRIEQTVQVAKAANGREFASAWQGSLRRHCAPLQQQQQQHVPAPQHRRAHLGAASSSSSSGSGSGSGRVAPGLLRRRPLRDSERAAEAARASAGGVAALTVAPLGVVDAPTLRLSLSAASHLRHCLQLTAGFITYADKGDALVVFDAQGQPTSAHFRASNVFRSAFTDVYDNQKWTGLGGGSGGGSTLPYTANIRSALTALLLNPKYNITSMLDSSCGSMWWMPRVLRDVAAARPGFRFLGTDAVCSLIDRHKLRFANESNWGFSCVDYANQRLPSGYDLVFSRDSLQHVPLHAAWMFLNNVKASGARYLLVGSYIRHARNDNRDVTPGEYYAIDLTRPPFSLRPAPLMVIDEHTPDGKFMCLYEVSRLRWTDTLAGLV